MNEFGTFAKFRTPEEAKPLQWLLEINNIPYTITKETNQLDPIIIGYSMDPMFTISIPVHHFSEVSALVADTRIASGDIGVLVEREEYLSVELKQERLALQWIVAGYLLSCFFIAGIFVGLTLITASKRLKNGEKIKLYDQYTVLHGRVMLTIGIISTSWLIWSRIISGYAF